MYGLKKDCVLDASNRYFTLEDYAGAVPRWCPGCGDHAVLTAVQRVCRDEQLPPEKTVFVSGIGCSSRLPHYMSTYGFHGLHGRSLPVACGIRARRPDLNIFVTTGDGDCISIGGGHWLHAIHYNMNMVVMLLDNNVYGLTKNQTSPTSLKGRRTNTHPRGAFLEPIDPVQATLGITNVSFVAQTVDWSPPHLLATLTAAHRHPGLAFVRVLQRCPHYPEAELDMLRVEPWRILLLTHPDGIDLEESATRMFRNQQEHDPSDLDAARLVAAHAELMPIGIFYRNESADRYDAATVEGLATARAEKLSVVQSVLQSYRV